MTIGERLYNLRKGKNLLQEDLANELDVSRQSISKWETDQSMPDFDKIIALCQYFGITTDELLTGKKDIIEAKETDMKSNYAKNLAIAVGLYIFSAVALIIFAAGLELPIIGVCFCLTFVAVATGIIIYNSIMYGNKKNKTEEEKEQDERMKLVGEVIDLLGVITYFLVSFLTMAWHITWIIFLIIPAVKAIIKILFSFKSDEVKEEKTNEQDN